MILNLLNNSRLVSSYFCFGPFLREIENVLLLIDEVLKVIKISLFFFVRNLFHLNVRHAYLESGNIFIILTMS